MTDNLSSRPTQPNKRIETLDILRGFAIFGIFMVNVEIMNCVFMNQDAFGAQWTGTVDKLAVRIKQLIFYNKFFPIFSLLFGIGISIQIRNIRSKGISPSFFYRRMFALFIFGVAHILFLWSGDVIHLYAVLGVLTFALVRLSSKRLFWLALLLLIFPFYNQLFEWLLSVTGYTPESYLSAYSATDIVDTIRGGSYIDGIKLRIQEYKSNVTVLFVFLMPIALAMFVLGLAIGKKDWLYEISSKVNQIKKSVLLIALVSNLYRVFFLFFLWDLDIWKDPFWREVFIYLMQICDTLMGLFYVWVIAYLCQYKRWINLFIPLKAVGKMALTNYLLQSFIGLIIFSSLGFEKYETFSPYQTLLIALIVFVFQIIISTLWLQYFKYGPMEWLWRCISYWKILPFKK
ncbi:DUF418 domain-containing protein [Dokdonia sinensis]|uniref:DUF418 domain-containing protein n=1 Tax=Dokdonia sinensis TaxID=2479847 RepID=A0A3M0G4J1_9FLAO|nr:DUF418 domain-containing protein [Dokdonia sinensis]RMB59488.1 DUF418 domain-containing protein [Dokdonia sinensis]